jgi:ABC-type lipoprotein release transport system permease subunit
MIDVRLGLRNLFRNRWRSGLTLAAVAVAVALMVWTIGFLEGWLNSMTRGMTGLETLQVQVQTVEHVRNPRVYRTFEPTPEQLRRVAELPGVKGVVRRAELHGLIGTERRSQVARLIGVEAGREAEVTPIAEAVVAGRWLAGAAGGAADRAAGPAAGGGKALEAVLGQGLARQLEVAPGDELVVFLEGADGSLGNDVLRVVGTVHTGNSMLDRSAVYLHLEDAQYLGALGDGIHRLAIRIRDPDAARGTAAGVAAALGAAYPLPPDAAVVGEEALAVLTWQELTPALDQMIQLSRGSYWIMYLLIYLIAAVGVLNTQRMSAMERRREFGVMMAIGMRPRRLFRSLLVETAVLGLVGAALGALLGGAITWYHATVGLNLALFSDSASFSYMGVTFSERIHFALTTGALLQPVLVMVGVAVVSGLWPAIRAARIDPAPTIAGRT